MNGFSLEVESELEVFEMKQEIVSLQAKSDDVGGKSDYERLPIFFLNQSFWINLPLEDECLVFKKVVGKGWRNSVMQRRIYGR